MPFAIVATAPSVVFLLAAFVFRQIGKFGDLLELVAERLVPLMAGSRPPVAWVFKHHPEHIERLRQFWRMEDRRK